MATLHLPVKTGQFRSPMLCQMTLTSAVGVVMHGVPVSFTQATTGVGKRGSLMSLGGEAIRQHSWIRGRSEKFQRRLEPHLTSSVGALPAAGLYRLPVDAKYASLTADVQSLRVIRRVCGMNYMGGWR
jgi:hypothetical protein